MAEDINNEQEIEGEETEETPPAEDKTPTEEDKKNEDDKEKDDSYKIQKHKWREKFYRAKAELEALKIKPAPTQKESGEPDDKERQAQEYLRNFFRQEYKNILSEQKLAEDEAFQSLEDKVDTVLEDNSDVTEDELLDVMEEFEVEPEIALKIIKKSRDKSGTPKPKMPLPKRGAPTSSKEKPDDSDKPLWQIAREVVKDIPDEFWQGKRG